MSDHQNVMILGEIIEGSLGPITMELLGAGRNLADESGEELHALIVCSNPDEPAKEAIAYGADKVCVLSDAILEYYQADSYVPSILKVIEEIKPRYLIMGNTEMGQDLGPRLAFRLGTALATDCIGLTIDKDTKALVMTKPVYGGKAMADFACDTFPQMAAVRPKSMKPLERDDSRAGEVINMDAGIDQSQIRTKIINKIVEESEGIKLEDAEIIISGGRGIGGKEGFQRLEELAGLFKNAALGASRPACDAEWVSTKIQVGITGKIVAPKVYLAIAISGASQHLTGCSGSEVIIAINKDESAPIFQVAKFGMVGDWNTALPAFTAKVRELLK